MKSVSIVGKNYIGKYERTRIACRGIIVENGRILLSHAVEGDLWMLPGGGLEAGENEIDCCKREVLEETGRIVCPSSCVLEIDEYYQKERYVTKFFLCTIVGRGDKKLTEQEKEARLEARFLPVSEAMEIFSRHASYADTDEEKRGLYLREYTALTAFMEKNETPEKET